MLKNPIPKVTNQLQQRAIGIINGKYTPHDSDQLNRGLYLVGHYHEVCIYH